MTEMFPGPSIVEWPFDEEEVLILTHEDVVEFVACCMYNSTDPTFGWGMIGEEDKQYWMGLSQAAVEAVALLIAGPEIDDEEE